MKRILLKIDQQYSMLRVHPETCIKIMFVENISCSETLIMQFYLGIDWIALDHPEKDMYRLYKNFL